MQKRRIFCVVRLVTDCRKGWHREAMRGNGSTVVGIYPAFWWIAGEGIQYLGGEFTYAYGVSGVL
jgi:hypothetical protein